MLAAFTTNKGVDVSGLTVAAIYGQSFEFFDLDF